MRTANDDLLDIYYKNKKKMENKVTDPIQGSSSRATSKHSRRVKKVKKNVDGPEQKDHGTSTYFVIGVQD